MKSASRPKFDLASASKFSITNTAIQQSLAADGAIASFSSNLFPVRLNGDRAPQLKADVRRAMSSNSPENALARIDPALDRFQEAHFWIHALEQFYHYADPFRWHLNAFLKSLKEVPQLIQMGLQNEDGFAEWFETARTDLRADPLMKVLFEHRDFVVHRGMLVPDSYGAIGITEGSGIKLGTRFPLDPLEDSDTAMDRYLHFVAKDHDFLGLLIPDEESLPCVRRVWRISPFKEEIVTLAARAWLRTGETVDAVIRWFGMTPPGELSLDCRHSSQKLEFRLYDRDKLNRELAAIRNETHVEQIVGRERR